MNHSPKLRKAMADIEAILKENDIAGIIILHNVDSITGNRVNGFSEYLFHIDPSYSCASFEEDNKLRIRARASDYGGDEVAKSIALATTANMLVHLKDVSKLMYRNTERASYTLDNIINAEHTKGE